MDAIRAAVFDMDGTLLDTEHFQWRGWVEVLKPFDIEMDETDYLQYTGKSAETIEYMLMKRYGLEVKPGDLVRKKEELINRWFREDQLEWMPHAEYAINFFRDRGMRTAIATSGNREEMMIKLERLGAARLFDALVCKDDVENTKPDPEIYRLACKKIGSRPEHTVAFEDTRAGVRAAQAAGLITIAIPNKYSRIHAFSKALFKARDFESAIQELIKRDMIC